MKSICCTVLRQLLAGWNGSEDAGSLKVILGEPTLQTVSIKFCSGHQGGSIGGVDPDNSGQIFNRLFRLIQLEIDFAPQCIRLLLMGIQLSGVSALRSFFSVANA